MKEYKLVPIGDVKTNPGNPNKHSPEQIERLKELIEYYGWRHPIIVSNQSGMVVVGHGRLEAARSLGLKEVPVDYQDFDSPEQEFGFMVADNAIASWAELDLSSINTELPGLGPDFDINLLGIKDFTLDMAEKDHGCDDDEVPEAKGECFVKSGDLFILGEYHECPGCGHVEM